MTERHRGYTITHNPPPVPWRDDDYRYASDEYTGPGDNRCGSAASVEACKAEIDELVIEALEAERDELKQALLDGVSLTASSDRWYAENSPAVGGHGEGGSALSAIRAAQEASDD